MKFEDRIQLKLSDLTEELFEKIVAYGFCAPSGMGGPGCVIMIAEDGKSYQFYGSELDDHPFQQSSRPQNHQEACLLYN